jgi:hypothetical protein
VDNFFATLGPILALVIGVVLFIVIVWLLARLAEFFRGTNSKAFIAQEFIRKDALVTVKTTGRETLERVKFLGFSKAQGARPEGVPFPFTRMAVFENEALERIYIPSTHIQYIKELPVVPKA